MKRLPESELEIMMIIWRHDGPVNRMEIEEHLHKDVAAPTGGQGIRRRGENRKDQLVYAFGEGRRIFAEGKQKYFAQDVP